MQLALDDAGLDAVGIGHVNAHGTSTPLNDATEAEAHPQGVRRHHPAGHVDQGRHRAHDRRRRRRRGRDRLLSLRDGIVPPTANLEQIGDDIGLDVVAGEPRPIERKPVLSNSFGFGGHNATLILGSRRVDCHRRRDA